MSEPRNEERLLQLGADAGIPQEVMRDLIESCRMAVSGTREPAVMRNACERMDRLREENRQRFGVQDIGVDIIRAFRDRE
jgi:hypothetical protein